MQGGASVNLETAAVPLADWRLTCDQESEGKQVARQPDEIEPVPTQRDRVADLRALTLSVVAPPAFCGHLYNRSVGANLARYVGKREVDVSAGRHSEPLREKQTQGARCDRANIQNPVDSVCIEPAPEQMLLDALIVSPIDRSLEFFARLAIKPRSDDRLHT
jgi:hypothetical protein